LLLLGMFVLAGCEDDPSAPEDPVLTEGRDTIEVIDDFDLSAFEVRNGDAEFWRVEDGALIGDGIVEHSPIVHESGTIEDGWIEVELDRADDGGIVFRYQDDANYYLVGLRDDATSVGPSGENSNIELYRFTDGQWESLIYGGVDVSWPRGQRVVIRVWAIEDVLLVFFGDYLVLGAQDSHGFASGGLGLRTNSHFGAESSVRYRVLRWGTF